jgi:tetratricopeptide (TPR) repeat protein
MHRTLNVRFLVLTLAVLALLAGAIYALHEYQAVRNAPRVLARAERFLAEKKLDYARRYLDQYLALKPNDIDVRAKRAVLLDESPEEDREDVIAALRGVLRDDPKRADLRYRLLLAYAKTHQIDDALREAEYLRDTWSDTAQIEHILGWCYEGKHRYAEAAEAFRKALALDPSRVASAVLLTEVLAAQMAQTDNAEQRASLQEERDRTMRQLVQNNPDSAAAHLARYRYLKDQKNLEDATAELATAQAKAAKDDAAPALAAAEWELEKHQLDKAAAILESAIRLHPRNDGVYRALAYLQRSQMKRDLALKTVEEGLKITPDSFTLRILQIDLLIESKNFAAAQQRIDELRFDWKSPLLDFLEGWLLYERGQDQKAVALLESAAEKMAGRWSVFNDWSNWPSRVHAVLGQAYDRRGDGANRLNAYRQATLADPQWDLARFGYGAALFAAGQYDEAAKELERVVGKKDVPASASTLLCRALFEDLKRRDESERDWPRLDRALRQARAADAEQGLKLDLLAAEILELRDRADDARALLQRLQRDDAPRQERIALTLARADLEARQGNVGKGLALLAAARKTLGDDADLTAARIRLLAQRAQDEDRVALKQLALDADKSNAADHDKARLFRELALAWQRIGDMAQAQATWGRVADLKPGDLESRQAMLDLAIAEGRFEAAHRLLARLKDADKGKGRASLAGAVALALAEAHQGRTESLSEARRNLEALKALEPTGPRVELLAGRIDELEGHLANALKHYQKAIELGERDPALVLNTVRRLLDRRFQDPRIVSVARQLLERHLGPEHHTIDSKRLAAEVALLDGAYEQARALANDIVPPGTRDYRALLWKASILDGIDDAAGAEQALRSAVEFGGHTPDTWMALLEHQAFLAGKPDDVARTLEKLKDTVSSRRRDYFLARCYEALGRFDDADQAYRRQLAETPGDYLLYLHAAEFYRLAQRFDRARECYQKLLDMGPSVPAEILARARRGFALLLADTDPQLAIKTLEPLRPRKELLDDRLETILRARLGDRDRAIEQLQDSFAQLPPRADELAQYARLLTETGNRPAAREAYEQLLRMRKTRGTLQAYHDFLMHDADNERDRIEQLVEELKRRGP